VCSWSTNGINVAFMQRAYLSDIEAARRTATNVFEHCALAIRTKWTSATKAEAHLILGRTREALGRYQQ
jgi:hypothetical protein